MSNEIRGTVAATGNVSGAINVVYGKDGLSAYEIAVKHGHTAQNEEEWLDSLKGERGESGVYLGSGEMPADCNVQIDPNGDPVDIDEIVADAISDYVTPEGTIRSAAADFAEVGEWLDGNPNNEDRRGYFVCIDNNVPGAHIRIATSTDDVRGAIMGIPGFAGNCTKDKFDKNGNLLPKYDYVGVMGLIPVIDNGTCTINGRCMPADDGTAVPSSNSLGYHVVDRIDNRTVLVVIEPGADMIQRVKVDANKYVAKTDVLSDVSAANYMELEKPVNTQAVINYFGQKEASYLDKTELRRMFADGEIKASNIYYIDDRPTGGEGVTIAAKFDSLDTEIGNVDSALDNIIAIQNSLIGGDGE